MAGRQYQGASGFTNETGARQFQSSEGFQNETVSSSAQTVFPASITSAEAFGTVTVTLQVIPDGIPSEEAFGTVTVTGGSGGGGPIPSSSFVARQNKPTVRNIFIAEVAVKWWARDWVLHTGSTYRAPIPLPAPAAKPSGDSTAFTVDAVFFAGTPLTYRASIALVDANAGSWYWDGTNLYVRPLGGYTLFSGAYIANLTYRFASQPKIYNGYYYEPRLKSVPRLSLRIEPRFSGVGQLGGGTISFLNKDGFFDKIRDLQWQAGQCVLKMAIDDPPSLEMAYTDVADLGYWNIEEWNTSDDEFSLKLVEPKAALETSLPLTFYDRTAYPNIHQDYLGKPIPLAYGKVYGANPALIDPALKKFKVCSHAIKSFDDVRVKQAQKTQRVDTLTAWVNEATDTYKTNEANTVESMTFNGTKLTKADDLAACISTASRFFQDGVVVYVHTLTPGQNINAASVLATVSYTTNIWASIPFKTVDLPNGEFTLGLEYNSGAEVAVDLTGAKNADGTPMFNVADIASDLFSKLGITSINTTKLAATKAYFATGFDSSGDPVVFLKPSLYIASQEDGRSIFGKLNEACGTYLYYDLSGQVVFGVFSPVRSTSLPSFLDVPISFGDADILEAGPDLESESLDIFSTIKLNYAERIQDGWFESISIVSDELLRSNGLPAHRVEEREVALWDATDARYHAQRLVQTEAFPLRRFTIRIPWQAFLLKPGDFILVTYTRHSINAVVEILEVSPDLIGGNTRLTLGFNRNIGDNEGFWTGDSEAAWSAGWTADQKTTARLNSGYWCDDNGFPVTSDRLGFRGSVWI